VACAQFAFFNEFAGKKPPDDCEKGGHDPAKTKAELIKYLKDSFDSSAERFRSCAGTRPVAHSGRSRAKLKPRKCPASCLAQHIGLRFGPVRF
jgi:hypothetical protein